MTYLKIIEAIGRRYNRVYPANHDAVLPAQIAAMLALLDEREAPDLAVADRAPTGSGRPGRT